MSEMIERVARIMSESDPDFESYHTIAERIIDAMRMPTDEMRKAGREEYENGSPHEYVSEYVLGFAWGAMIDAALK